VCHKLFSIPIIKRLRKDAELHASFIYVVQFLWNKFQIFVRGSHPHFFLCLDCGLSFSEAFRLSL
jgi:hypothetical protein